MLAQIDNARSCTRGKLISSGTLNDLCHAAMARAVDTKHDV